MMFLYQQPPTDYLTIMFLIYIKTSSTAFIYLDALGIVILSNKIPTYVHKFWSFNLICIQNKKLQFYEKLEYAELICFSDWHDIKSKNYLSIGIKF